MSRLLRSFLIVSLFIGLVSIGGATSHLMVEADLLSLEDFYSQEPDSIDLEEPEDDGSIKFPIKDQSNTPYEQKFENGAMDLEDPDNAEYRTEYDPNTNQVTIYRKIGGVDVRLPYTMSLQEYMNTDTRKSMNSYYRDKVQSDAGNSTSGAGRNWLSNAWKVGGDGFESIFGSNTVSIKPQGTAELTIGMKHTRIDNPTLQEELRKTTTFDFQQKIQVNVQAAIGDKLKMGLNYNTEASFDFENETKLEYAGKEDDIIRKIEFGNVTMPLPGTLITGSQSLFGIKTELQFGKLNVVTLFSQQKGETQVLNVQGGAQEQEFKVKASEYDKNRHFFLSLEFRKQFETSLYNLPVTTSPFVVQKVEVWVTNKTGQNENSRNAVAFTDLGEHSFSTNSMWTDYPSVPPSNDANNIYSEMDNTWKAARNLSEVSTVFNNSFFTTPGFSTAKDYEKIENARRLNPSEYTLSETLGFISLNSSLNNDEILAVAYEYSYNGTIYKVGDLSTDGIEAPKNLYLKLIKGTNLSPDFKTTWQLMMKNIYSIGAFQVNSDDFRLNIGLLSDSTGGYINYLPEGGAGVKNERLLKLMNLDNLNQQNEPTSTGDGVFDFVPSLTIYPSNGRIIFPVLEPFGSHLSDTINDASIAKKYVFQELYDSTLTTAGELAAKDKFVLYGKYKSSGGSDISLNAMDIPQGGVTVSAGGIRLVENVDYTVDYTLGRVKIINKGLLESGTPIQVSLESRSLFNLQTKTLMGAHFDYKFNPKLNIGATIMNLNERPLTTKVTYGSEPISNTIWGFNGTYNTDSEALTNFLNKAPWWNLKEKSSLTVEGEFAQLVPGHNSAVGKTGQSYIDDFEGTKSSIDLRNWTAWSIASTPQGQADLFPEASGIGNVAFGENRARLAWYVIDPLFYSKGSTRPDHINDDAISDDRVRQVDTKEIFPERNNAYGQPSNLSVLNLAYYPDERGQYNFDTDNIDPTTGRFINPIGRWGGIMRSIETNDFEAANISYIEFWVMDPTFGDASFKGGDLYVNLGTVSEDVLRDGRKAFEQGLPVPGEDNAIDTTAWGAVPTKQNVVSAFNNDPASRFVQDVGFDGLNSSAESTFFDNYLNSLPAGLPADLKAQMMADPSSDDYHYFRGSDYDASQKSILDRYKLFNNPDGNSKSSEYSPESYSTAATSMPDQEDLNKDYTLSESESYFQYKMSLDPSQLKVGQNYITDRREALVTLPNDQQKTAVWYQVRIPVDAPTRQSINNIKDLRSVRFMRMFLKDCPDTTILRFATLDLVRGDWRRFTSDLSEGLVAADTTSSFDLSAVNIEENSGRSPINYVLPPGVDRTQDPANPQLRLLNEQSIVLRVNELKVGDARAAYKSMDMDIRQYKRLKMYVHAEAKDDGGVADKDLVAFIRIGSDFTNNYYEYEVPLKVSPFYQNSPSSVWPTENEFNINLESLQQVKLERNDLRRSGSLVDYNKPFRREDPENVNNTIVIMGSPSLSNVQNIMIGVRNRRTATNIQAKSAEIWMNELRLTDFDEKGGWAANARMNLKLAEFGSVSVAGLTSTIGFGSIEKGVSERSQQDFYQYDVASSLELGKTLGPSSRMSIPFYSSVSQAVATPKYYPVDPDIELATALKNADSKAEKDSIKQISQDVTTRRSINFTNVRLQPKSESVKVYDPSNLSATYSYNETEKRNINTEYSTDQNYRGMLAYNYSTRPKAFEPFSKSSALSSPSLRLIKDFNLYPYPNQVSYTLETDRNYREEKLRNLSDPNQIFEPIYKKDFYFNRLFDLKYAITKNLKFDFKAITNLRIQEEEGANTIGMSDIYSSLSHGRKTAYQHTFNFNYTIPINKLPYLDWTSATLRYGGMYNWLVAPLTRDASINMGNTIKNSNTIQANGQLNFNTLYNKSTYLKEIWKKYDFKPKTAQNQNAAANSKRFSRNGVALTAGTPFAINHKLKNNEITVRVFDKTGKPVKGTTKVISPMKAEFIPEVDAKDARLMVTATGSDEDGPLQVATDITALLLTSIKSFAVTYSESNGTVLPGYRQTSGFLGMNGAAPGVPFIMGMQDREFAEVAAGNQWLTNDVKFNTPYQMVKSKDISFRTNIEPVRGFKIELVSDRRETYSLNEYYRDTIPDNKYQIVGPMNTRESGTFSMSFIAFSTFKKVSTTGTLFSSTFQEFLDNRPVISHRLAEENNRPSQPDSTGYAPGYGALSQDVLIPSFLSAYSGISPNSIFLSAMPALSTIMPNWRVSYDGIGRIPVVSKVAKNVDLSHAYRCTYNVGNYTTNLGTNSTDNAGNYVSQYQIGTVVINEQFSPLILVNVTWVNNITTRVEFKKGRIMSLSMANNQLIENYNDEWSVGLGYRFDKLGLILNNSKITNDINLRVDYSERDNTSVIRKIQESVNQLTAGMKISAFTFTADYMINNRFNVQLYYKRNVNTPYISLSYPITNSNYGLSFRFSLSQ